jgi:hypothetical protein
MNLPTIFLVLLLFDQFDNVVILSYLKLDQHAAYRLSRFLVHLCVSVLLVVENSAVQQVVKQHLVVQQVVQLGQRKFSLNHCAHTVVHILNQAGLAESESTLVANIVDVVICLGVLTVGPADLNVEFVSNRLELGLLFA